MPTLPRTRMPSPRRLAAAVGAALFVASALGACKSDKNGPASILGTYILRTVDAKTVPATVLDQMVTDPNTGQQVRETAVINDGNLTLAQGNSYTVAIHATETVGSQSQPQTVADHGSYTQSGSTLTFTSAVDQSVITATLNNNTITASQDIGLGVPTTLVFSK